MLKLSAALKSLSLMVGRSYRTKISGSQQLKVAGGALCTLWWQKLANSWNLFLKLN